MQSNSDDDVTITKISYVDEPDDVVFVREEVGVSPNLIAMAGALASLAPDRPAPEDVVFVREEFGGSGALASLAPDQPAPEPAQPMAVSAQPEAEPDQAMQEPEPDQAMQQPEPDQAMQQPEPDQAMQQPEPDQAMQEPEPDQSMQQPEPDQSVVAALTGGLAKVASEQQPAPPPAIARVLLMVHAQPRIVSSCVVESPIPIQRVSVVISNQPMPRALKTPSFGSLAINRVKREYDIVKVLATRIYGALDFLLDAAENEREGKGRVSMDSSNQHAEDRSAEDYFSTVDAFHENIQACKDLKQKVKLVFSEDHSLLCFQWVGVNEYSQRFLMELECEKQPPVV